MSTQRSLVARALVAGVLLAGIGAPQAAQAGPVLRTGGDRCPVTRSVCVFEETVLRGRTATLINIPFPVPGAKCVSLTSPGWQPRSAANRFPQSVALFANENCQGDPYQVPASSNALDLGSFVPKSVWLPSA